MNGRLAAIESEEVRHVDRADRAAAELAQLNNRLTIPEINDPARRRISFIGFMESSTNANRIGSMYAFMRELFPDMKHVGVNLLASKDVQRSLEDH